MAMVQTQDETVGHTPVEKKTAPTPRTNKKVYCILCRKTYLRHEGHEHMHSMLHHRELEIVLGRDSFHECQACKASSMGLNTYAQHISTSQHKAKLKSLISKKSVKPIPLCKTLSQETMGKIIERNKMLKNKEKKEMRKRRKKMKQEAGQRRQMLQGKTKRKQEVARTTQKKQQQVKVRLQERPEQTQQKGSSKALVKNKENRLTGLRRSLHQSQLRLQQSGGHFLWPEEPPGRVGHHPHLQTQSSPSARHLRYEVYNFSVNSDLPDFTNQCSQGKDGSFQTDRLVKRPKNTRGSATDTVDQSVRSNMNQYEEYNRRYGSVTDEDFTSDQPCTGAIIFDQGQDKGKRSSQASPGQGPHCSTTPASASTSMCLDRSLDTGPIRDNDVNAMLWQIRRALGVMEPCRADRAARSQKQINQANVQEVDQSTVQQAVTEREYPSDDCFSYKHREEAASHNTFHISRAAVDNSNKAPSVQSLQVGTTAPASPSSVSTAKVTSVKAKRRTVKGAEEAQQSESSEVACVSDGQSNGDRESQGGSAVPRLGTLVSLNRCMGKTTSAEPNLNAARRIRNVNESRKTEGEKEAGLKPTLQKLLSSSGSQRKVNWTEMYQEANRKKHDKVKGMPRFGIELINPLSDQEGSPQVEDEDFAPSEGFHWETEFPVNLQTAPCLLPALPQDTTDNNDSVTERPSESRMQESTEQPGTALGDGRTVRTMEVVHHVKVEPNLEEGENGNLGRNCNVNHDKKHKVDGGISNMEPCGKKRKTKSNKDQDKMDRLLAVSLREEELSHSLVDVDNSLIQARNALQAAYTEVQRLLLLKQQFNVEVNSLRAKRIEILQGMQDGYSGAANVASSISHPHSASLALPSMSVKKEICNPPTDGQTSQPGKTVLPTLLLTPSNSASTTPVVASPRQPIADSSTSVNALPSSDSSIKQQIRQGLTDSQSRRRMRLAKEEAHPTDCDSDLEKTGGNCSEEHAIPTVVPERHKNKSTAAQDPRGGDESDCSVEMMEPSSGANLDVIDIEESDNEDVPKTTSNVPGHPEPQQKLVGVEFNTACTQTFKFKEDNTERRIQVPAVSGKDARIPPESAEVVEDEEPFLGTFEKHRGPVHGLQIHQGLLYTCSGDNTARAYGLVSRQCLAVFKGHTNKINCLLVSSLPNMPARLYTGSSDQTIRCYSTKSKKCLDQLSLPDRVLCLHIAWNILYAGLANGSVVSYDLKTLKQLDVFECHGPRGVSCLGTAQEGARRVLLVGSYDSTISVRDAKSSLLLRSLEGHTKTVLCLKVVNDLVFSGSSDTSVHAHNIHTGELVRIYKGHGHAVTSIAILGKVMVTACLDKLVRVYELQSHDRLQVYGGHSDMVMCMAIHKSMIYTGCYDGRVQAVKLNLMKNYRCWWQPCTLIFGMAEHLLQHLLGDHSNPRLQTVKCRWRGCDTFFATQDAVRRELPEHMQSHVEQDSKVEP